MTHHKKEARPVAGIELPSLHEGTAVALPVTRNLRAAPARCKGRCNGRAP